MRVPALMLACLALAVCLHGVEYPWLEKHDPAQSIGQRIAVPDGYERVRVEKRSFDVWLRGLPLKPADAQVMLHNGQPKKNQKVHAAVINIDTGTKNLQQCADAVIRLRAEYLLARKKTKDIHFKFTSGDNAQWTKWLQGYRAEVAGNKVRWVKKARRSTSYETFKSYLQTVFIYAGSASLNQELHALKNPTWLQAGDVFIKGGFPGHAVMVIDVAQHKQTGEKIFLLAQSYMPAQDMHILVNPMDPHLSPWYRLAPAANLKTPEWEFKWNQLKSFEKRKRARDTRRTVGLVGTFKSMRLLPGPTLAYIVTWDVRSVKSGSFDSKTVTFVTFHYYGGQDLMYALGYNVGDGFSGLRDKPIDKTQEFELVVKVPPQKVSVATIKKYKINADLAIWKIKKKEVP